MLDVKSCRVLQDSMVVQRVKWGDENGIRRGFVKGELLRA